MNCATRRIALSVLTIPLVADCLAGGGEPVESTLVEGEDVRLEGRVTEIDRTPMFVDGDARIDLESEAHGAVDVRVPARERRCPAQGLDVLSALGPGDRLRASGRVTGSREVTVCEEATHFLEELDAEVP